MIRRFTLPLLLILSLLMAACQPVLVTPQPSAPTPAVETPAAPAEAALPDIVETAVAAGQFKTLVAALEATDLVAALRGEGPFTVFAPTDEAFAKLPAGTLDALLADTETLSKILLYHVLPGAVMAADVTDGLSVATLEGSTVSFSVADGTAKINDATIVATDIKARNGVIHVIDAVILPPSAQAAPTESDVTPPDIVDTAVAAGQFNTLLQAVQAAGLEETLKGEGPFTVFAPTDEAFAKLPAGTLEALLADPARLKDVLLYHVVEGNNTAAELLDKGFVTTLLGRKLTINRMGDQVTIGKATVISPDLQASNGVVHVIDTVLVP